MQQTWESLDSIDELIERLENESEEQELFSEDAVGEEDINSAQAPESRWFFARLFRREVKQIEEITIIDEAKINNVEENIDQHSQVNQEYQQNEIQRPYIWYDAMSLSSSNIALSKFWDTPQWTDRWVSSWVEGINSAWDESFHNNYYTIAVHSLKLNNKYFNQTLWYLMRGDIIKQISAMNSFWCFEAEVVSSHTAPIEKWYVCKKYLQIYETETEAYESIIETEKQVFLNTPKTQIGDIVTVQVAQLDIQKYALFEGDTIDQMTDLDKEWCFIWRVLSVQAKAYSELIGHVQKFCPHMLYDSLDSL